MAATKRNAMLIEEARTKIQTTQLINRLQNHSLGKVEMSATQVRATEILLRKAVPDLASVTVDAKVEDARSVRELSTDSLLALVGSTRTLEEEESDRKSGSLH